MKQSILRVAASAGFSKVLLESSWRRQRLLILCYHGIAMEDEHCWSPSLYMEPGVIARRFELLRENRCAVLPLQDAIRRLYTDELPPRSVAITVDDGTYDFYKLGLPLVRDFGYPVTIYVTTYYSEFNRPVFDPALYYILWKGAGGVLGWPGVVEAVRLDGAGQEKARLRIVEHARRNGLSGRQKDELLGELASRIGVDYPGMCAKRMFSLMAAGEIREAAAAGVDIQLHTHRHKVYRQEDRFLRELEDNHSRLEPLTGTRMRHFCYPSGYHQPEFLPWLRSWGVESAVTCEPGLADRRSDPLMLPRLVDVTTLSEIEFTSWICGLGALLPRRRRAMDEHSLAD